MNSDITYKGDKVHTKTKTIILFGVLSCLLTGAITGIPAVIMGHRAFSKHRRNVEIYSATDRRIILGGIVLGYIGITITMYFFILGLAVYFGWNLEKFII